MADHNLFEGISKIDGTGNAHHRGQFLVDSQSVFWKQNHAVFVRIPICQIEDITWIQDPTTNRLAILDKDGVNHRFTGFTPEDVSTLTAIFKDQYKITVGVRQVSVAGRNRGTADLRGDVLSLAEGPDQLFELSLANVVKTNVIKETDDVVLEFDTSSQQNFSMSEIVLHVPGSSTRGSASTSTSTSAAEELGKRIKSVTQAIVTFHGITLLHPRRGKHVVELHRSFLMAERVSNTLKVDYEHISHVFMLAKDDTSDTHVAIRLHTPICIGRRLYSYVVFQFDATGYKVIMVMPDFGDTPERCIAKSLTEIICDFSDIKLTETCITETCITNRVCFITETTDRKGGFCFEALLKDQPGLLYPLEDCFLFLPVPPTRISYDQIKYVRFDRHGEEHFDVFFKLKTRQSEHLFQRIKLGEHSDFSGLIGSLDIRIARPRGG